MANLTTEKNLIIENVESENVAKFIACEAKNYHIEKKELSLKVRSSPKEQCFRLVFDGSTVLLFEEADYETQTGAKMFCGTEEDCKKEAQNLGLVLPVKDDHLYPTIDPDSIIKNSNIIVDAPVNI
jgi:hypothetical protein